jgi:hypothetical protein
MDNGLSDLLFQADLKKDLQPRFKARVRISSFKPRTEIFMALRKSPMTASPAGRHTFQTDPFGGVHQALYLQQPPRAFGFHNFRRTPTTTIPNSCRNCRLSNIKTTLDIYAQAITSAKLEAQDMFLTELMKGLWAEKKSASSFVV